jgi:hypothetical protein
MDPHPSYTLCDIPSTPQLLGALDQPQSGVTPGRKSSEQAFLTIPYCASEARIFLLDLHIILIPSTAQQPALLQFQPMVSRIS